MNYVCINKNWNSCIDCNLFDQCDTKEYNWQGVLVVLAGDFKQLLNRFKTVNERQVSREFELAEDDSELVSIRTINTNQIIFFKSN